MAVDERLEPVARLIQRFIDAGEIGGAAFAVAVHGQPVHSQYFGEAAPEHPSGPATLWPLASISKLYTAVAVMALVERGVLTLETTARSVLPRFDGEGRELVTLRHLLTHTSGLIYESPSMEAVLRRKTPVDAMIDEAYEHPLLFTPGTRFSYSDFGVALAGRMASVATGRSYPDLVRSLVLEPGGLDATFTPPLSAHFSRVARVVGCLADGTDSAQYNSPYGLGLAHPAFGTFASVEDLLRFGLYFRPGNRCPIVSSATVQAMTADQTGGRATGALLGADVGEVRPWGLGFAVRGATSLLGFGDLTSPASFGHPGASGCTVVVDRIHDVALAYCSNRHLRTNQDRFAFRLDAVVNVTLAALTGDPGSI
jgi:beta-lactamase class C